MSDPEEKARKIIDAKLSRSMPYHLARRGDVPG